MAPRTLEAEIGSFSSARPGKLAVTSLSRVCVKKADGPFFSKTEFATLPLTGFGSGVGAGLVFGPGRLNLPEVFQNFRRIAREGGDRR